MNDSDVDSDNTGSVASDGDTVNVGSGSAVEQRRYHHGRLRDSLVDAGLQLARRDGPGGLGLRAASRLAGVSHNAAYRHFADHEALMAAVGARCMRELALRMEAAQHAVTANEPAEVAWARLYAIGETYVRFAVEETGWFRTAFAAHGDPPAADAGLTEEMGAGDSGLSPFALLISCLDELVVVGAIAPERRPGCEFAAWSAVHGLSTLLVDGPLRGLPAAERDQALRIVLDTCSRGLASQDEQQRSVMRS